MNKLTQEEIKIIKELTEKYGDIFYSMIGSNYLNGMDLKTSIWDCYNKFNNKKNVK